MKPYGIPVSDIKLDENADFVTEDGDFVLTESYNYRGGSSRLLLVANECDDRHILDMLEAYHGVFREFPLVGIGARRWVNAPFAFQDKVELKNLIKTQLTADNMRPQSVSVSGQQIDITAIRLK